VDQRGGDASQKAEVQMRHDESRDHQEHADGDRHRLPTSDPHAASLLGGWVDPVGSAMAAVLFLGTTLAK
jgi:hypothetical protein